jgi:hypothetical protein
VTVSCDPNWRDQPDELDALCQQGARDLHGPAVVNRDIDDIEPPQEYL